MNPGLIQRGINAAILGLMQRATAVVTQALTFKAQMVQFIFQAQTPSATPGQPPTPIPSQTQFNLFGTDAHTLLRDVALAQIIDMVTSIPVGTNPVSYTATCIEAMNQASVAISGSPLPSQVPAGGSITVNADGTVTSVDPPAGS